MPSFSRLVINFTARTSKQRTFLSPCAIRRPTIPDQMSALEAATLDNPTYQHRSLALSAPFAGQPCCLVDDVASISRYESRERAKEAAIERHIASACVTTAAQRNAAVVAGPPRSSMASGGLQCVCAAVRVLPNHQRLQGFAWICPPSGHTQ